MHTSEQISKHRTKTTAMVHLPPQVDKICQKIDAFMVNYPTLTQYGASPNKNSTMYPNPFNNISLSGVVPIFNTESTWGKFCQSLLIAQGVHNETSDYRCFSSTSLVFNIDPRQCGVMNCCLFCDRVSFLLCLVVPVLAGIVSWLVARGFFNQNIDFLQCDLSSVHSPSTLSSPSWRQTA